MIKIRKASERGKADLGWLKATYTFSFSHYFDPNYMGERVLRVLNHDVISPGMGFATHPHDNMEIITFILRGKIAHKDNLGNIETISTGEIQIMSAGTGITHSEFNPDPENETELFQIWVKPKELNIKPHYFTYKYEDKISINQLNSIAKLHNQDMEIYLGKMEKKSNIEYQIPNSKTGYWLQMMEGHIKINGVDLISYDGAFIENEAELTIQAMKSSSYLLMEMT
jgi:redox-sensitive bicupin YhaK (pirin superfamily)